jgi:predicted HAD superfamily Cof-like phosphohydrolase
MTDYYELVKNFHREFNLPIGMSPQNISLKQFSLRIRIILEELSEYSKAVGENNIVKIADGLGDVLWVVFGTAVEHGLPMDKIFEEIAKSNMSKIGGHLDDSGKWIKPETYKPVNLNWLKNDKADRDKPVPGGY